MDSSLEKDLEKLQKENKALRNEIEKSKAKAKNNKKNTKRALNWTWKLFSGKNLSSSFNDWFTEFHSDQKVSANTSASLLTAIVKRFVRVRLLSVILLLFSLIPSLVSLYILIKQNDLIKTQNSLVEASRNSSYSFQLTDVYNKIDKDGFDLSKSTINRIVGLTYSLKPYNILEEEGKLSEEKYSPEKTQLLLFLLNTKINRKNLQEIYDKANFSNCDLRNTNLTQKFLVGINLQNSNLEGCELHSSNLNEANLTNAILKGIKFSNGSAKNVILKNADLSDAEIKRVVVSGTNFNTAKTKRGAIIESKK